VSTVVSSAGGGIGRITLNRPVQMNAITVDLGRELEVAIRDLARLDDVSVIAVRGAGGNFCAGGDFQEVERLRGDGPAALAPLFDNFRRACDAIADVAQPVVAVVEGVAMAGGFEFLQAADVVLVREDARLSDNHINFGQVPGGGGSQRLARLVGRQRALGHLLSGERLSGQDAVSLGLAHRAFAAESFDDDVEHFLSRMAGRRRDALTSIKSLVRDGLELELAAGLDLERKAVLEHISGEAGGEGVASFAGTKGEGT
jgi:enoyl-CoA hydratase/carnithine racemase